MKREKGPVTKSGTARLRRFRDYYRRTAAGREAVRRMGRECAAWDIKSLVRWPHRKKVLTSIEMNNPTDRRLTRALLSALRAMLKARGLPFPHVARGERSEGYYDPPDLYD